MRRSLLTAALFCVWPLGTVRAEKLVADEWYQLEEREQSERRELKFKTLPGLVQIKRFKTEIVAPDFASTYRTFQGTASLVVSGSLVHPFSTTVVDPIIRIGFFSHEALERTWRRLTAAPLMLTEHELRQPLPHPSFHWVQDASQEGTFPKGSETQIRLETQFTNIRLQMRNLPELMVMIDGYNLEDPSPADLIKIVEDGGVVDFSAAATWAHSVLLERPAWPEAERKKLIQSLSGVLKSMRPPLKQGALARIHALTSIMNAVAKPQDLEELLGASENVAVLMTSVGLSYYDSVREETEFDLPIHQIGRLPSLQEFLKSFTHGLQEVRSHALAELVRLSFDPLDFRDAPNVGFPVSEVQKHAKALLEPLSPLNVNQLMLSVGDQTNKQLKLLNFYVDARHAPVIATLLHWLHENPDHADSLGTKAAAQLGVQIVPALLRTFLEPIDPLERDISRKMLLALPQSAQTSAIEAFRGTGVMLDKEVSIAAAISAFEAHERKAQSRKADLLEQSIFQANPDPKDAVMRMNLLADLARTTPERIEGRAKEIFPLLAVVAKQTLQSAPVHSERAISMFSTLPFGAFKEQAKIQLVLTQIDLLESQGKLRKAIEVLHKAEPSLTTPQLKLKYSQLSRLVIRKAIDSGTYPVAGRTLKAAKKHLPHDDRFDLLARELFFSRYKIAFVLGAIAIFSLVLCGAYVTAKKLAAALRNRLNRRKAPAKAPAKKSAPSDELEATQLGSAAPIENDAPIDDADEDLAVEPGVNPATDPGESLDAPAPVRTLADDFNDDFADEFDDELDHMEKAYDESDATSVKEDEAKSVSAEEDGAKPAFDDEDQAGSAEEPQSTPKAPDNVEALSFSDDEDQAGSAEEPQSTPKAPDNVEALSFSDDEPAEEPQSPPKAPDNVDALSFSDDEPAEEPQSSPEPPEPAPDAESDAGERDVQNAA